MNEEKKYTLEELKEKLTEKQRIFCHEYIIDWNGTRAARCAGYSEETSSVIAYENIRKPYIKQYINYIKNNLEEEAGITKLRNLKELAKIAYSNISHLHDDWITLKEWERIKEENPNCMAAIESIDTKTEKRTYNREGMEDIESEIKYVKIKLYSKSQAIDMINKMMGYNEPDKVAHSGSLNIDDFSNKTTAELVERAKAISKLSENKTKSE